MKRGKRLSRNNWLPANISGLVANIKQKSFAFDSDFYISKYQDVANAKIDPYKHYIDHGISEKRWPHPYFDPTYYGIRYAHELVGIADVFSYFLEVGLGRGHIAIPRFAPRWYARQYEDVRKAGIDPYLHFILHGDAEGRQPGPNFDSTSYQIAVAERSSHPRSALRHWLFTHKGDFDYKNEIFRQHIADADMFDREFYLDRYHDVQGLEEDALEHFVLHGAQELRSPNPITDMKLIDMVVKPASRNSESFRFYMEQFYNYDLDHQQNNYELWYKHFDCLDSADPDYIDALARLDPTPRVVAIVRIGPANVKDFGRVADLLCASVGCSVEICFVSTGGLTKPALDVLRSLGRSAHGARLLESEEDLHAAVKNCDFVLTLTESAFLDPLAVHILIEASRMQNASFVYSDHDRLIDGHRQLPDFKPDFSPSYLRIRDYCGPVLLAYRNALSSKTVSEMFLFLTRSSTTAGEHLLLSDDFMVGHAPFVTYHVPGMPSKLQFLSSPTTEDVTSNARSVSIIIPMRDKHELTKACVESILSYTSYPRYLMNIIIIDNDSVEASSLSLMDRLQSVPGIEVIAYKNAFNFSKINNYAASHVDSDVIVFLNNDTSVIDGQWLNKLVHHATMPDVGVVGAKLVYEDDTIQHGGCVVGAAGGYVEHLLVGKHYSDVAVTDATREMSVVTGACIAIEAKKFWEIGGFQSVLRVAWNDVFLCLSCLDRGYRNVYLSDAIIYHFESKSRGFDNSSEQKETFIREAAYTRLRFKKYFFDDPSYNCNLSLESAGNLALPPRVLKPWLRGTGRSRKVLMLSCVYNIGYGVPVVMERHARRMVERGWDVHIGGPAGTNEIHFAGCTRAILTTALQAAAYAYRHDIPVVVSHTPPFFRVTDYVGKHISVICYDYGEPNPKLFDDATMHYLENVNREKLLAFSLSTKVVAISQAVKSEGKFVDTTVVGLGNDHLAVWSEAMRNDRNALRERFGWGTKKVILNVCRFPKTERYYKGLDKYVEVMNQFDFSFGTNANDYVWALAGAAGQVDVVEMEALGLKVFPNLSNDDLADLYKAVDVYMSFSKWEGYNLGIGQALAMGLPVVASDIEAHREFPIFTSNSALDVAVWLKHQSEQIDRGSDVREAKVFKWTDSAEKFEILLTDIFHDLIAADTGSRPTH